jgi:HK97 family phage major capsid protein
VNYDNHIKAAHERKIKALGEMRSILDTVKAGEELTAEARQAFDRAEADHQSAADEIARFERTAAYDEARSAELARITAAAPAAAKADRSDEEILRSLALGETRSVHFEKRDVVKTSTGAPVPTSFYNQLVEHLVVVGPMLDPSVTTILTTAGGENLQIPRTSAYSTAAIVGEGTAISESDPTFSAFTTLGAFKYSVLFQVSREMVDDSGVDLLGFVARQAGISLATAVNKGLTVGTGTLEPFGVVGRASAGVTGGTGVSGAPTYENLVDLAYAVNSAYRRQGATWMGNAKAAATVRKIKDGQGAYIWQPSFQMGQPDMLLGHPWVENPDMVDPATNAKSIIFGHMPSYFVRQVRGVDIARSDDFAFSADLITFRATLRVDGDLPQTGAIKVFAGGTA